MLSYIFEALFPISSFMQDISGKSIQYLLSQRLSITKRHLHMLIKQALDSQQIQEFHGIKCQGRINDYLKILFSKFILSFHNKVMQFSGYFRQQNKKYDDKRRNPLKQKTFSLKKIPIDPNSSQRNLNPYQHQSFVQTNSQDQESRNGFKYPANAQQKNNQFTSQVNGNNGNLTETNLNNNYNSHCVSFKNPSQNPFPNSSQAPHNRFSHPNLSTQPNNSIQKFTRLTSQIGRAQPLNYPSNQQNSSNNSNFTSNFLNGNRQFENCNHENPSQVNHSHPVASNGQNFPQSNSDPSGGLFQLNIGSQNTQNVLRNNRFIGPHDRQSFYESSMQNQQGNNFENNGNNFFSMKGIHNLEKSFNQMNGIEMMNNSDLILSQLQDLREKVNYLKRTKNPQKNIPNSNTEERDAYFDQQKRLQHQLIEPFGSFEYQKFPYYPNKQRNNKMVIIVKPSPKFPPLKNHNKRLQQDYQLAKKGLRFKEQESQLNSLKQKEKADSWRKKMQDIEVNEFSEVVIVKYELELRYREEVPPGLKEEEIFWWQHPSFYKSSMYIKKLEGEFQITRPFIFPELRESIYHDIQTRYPKFSWQNQIPIKKQSTTQTQKKTGGKSIEEYLEDFYFKGQNPLIDIISIKPRLCRDSWFHRLIRMQPKTIVSNGLKQYTLKGIMYQKKISLGALSCCTQDDYELIHPQHFEGDVVRDLCIGNKNGKVTWTGLTNVENIVFKRGFLQIGANEISCSIEELQKKAVVEFYQIPKNVLVLLRKSRIGSKKLNRQNSGYFLEQLEKEFIEVNQGRQGFRILSIDLEEGRFVAEVDLSE